MPPADDGVISPRDAFATLGNETRLEILHELGRADGPLSFSELFDRCAYEDSANFDYHLDQLRGRFIRKSEHGYELEPRGRRIIETILSGVITQDTRIDRTRIDASCPRCGHGIEIRYRANRLEIYCNHCGGLRRGTSPTTDWAEGAAADIVGHLDVPPAGAETRAGQEVFRAAEVWTVAENQALSRGVCPRCAGEVIHAVEWCDEHEDSEAVCEACGQRFGVVIETRCTHCILEQESVFTKFLLGHPAVMGFLIDHGRDPVVPEGVHLSAVDETIHATDPFEASFTFTLDDDELSVTVNDQADIIEVTRG